MDVDDVLAEDTEVTDIFCDMSSVSFFSFFFFKVIMFLFSFQDFTKVESANNVKVDKDSESAEDET